MNDPVGQVGEILKRLNLPFLGGERRRWQVMLRGYPALVELEEGWVSGKVALMGRKGQKPHEAEEREASDWFNWLMANSRIAGPARFALAGGKLRLQGEVPLEEDPEGLYRVLKGLTEAFEGGLGVFEARMAGGGPYPPKGRQHPPRGGVKGGAARPGLLEECLGESGWPWEKREEGVWVARLQAEGVSRQVRVISDLDEVVRFQVELAGYGALEEEARQALGHLLLAEANRRLRFGRCSAIEAGGKGHVIAEVALEGEALSPWVAGCALEALAVACCHLALECEALQEPAVARVYFQSRRIGGLEKGG